MDYKIALLPLFLLTMCAPAPVTPCSLPLDGSPANCPSEDVFKLPRKQVRGEVDVWNPYHLHSLQMMFIRNAQIEKTERDMTQPSDAINNALVDFWEKQDGSNDPSK
tara:strand:+ start:981 stop:1301 length:321 start_codon:yes stop_codon:yes gene_type:complete